MKRTGPCTSKSLLERYQEITHSIFSLSNRGVLRIDFLQEVLKVLAGFSGCDVLELRLRERDKYYRCEFDARQGSFRVRVFHDQTGWIGEADGESPQEQALEQLCRDCIDGTLVPWSPFRLKCLGFWTGGSEPSIAPLKEDTGKRHLSAFDGAFRSLAVIPFEIEAHNVGILQLKHCRENCFSSDDVLLYEGIAQSFGVALANRRAQVDLRERVKELTCLFDIALLVGQVGLSLEQIITGIVTLLPPAWLYPEIACARIILDGRTFSSSGFKESPFCQTARIIVNGRERGAVNIAYAEERPELDEGPFLREERDLIEAVAREIALLVERRQAETEQSKLQEQLRHADRLATIGQLAAGVAHELNEPLGNILGFSQLAKKDPDMGTQPRKDIEKIEKSALHAREVIKKLMTFARQTPPRRMSMDLNQLIDEGLYFLESRCAKENIELTRNPAPALPPIFADKAQIHQVLVNLSVNGIQAMPKGGRLTITTEAGEHEVKLIVEDTGMGMTEKTVKKIFVPFFTTKEIGQGTGLGLSVVHGIVMSHGGSIEVDTHIGQGSRFEISLPVNGETSQGT